MCQQTSIFTSLWITMALTKPLRSGIGLPSGLASICISLRPTALGSTWSKGGLQKSQTNGFVAAFFEASKNSKRRSENTSPFTTKIPNRSYGPKLPTRFSPASLASRSAPLPHHNHDLSHEPMGRETSVQHKQIIPGNSKTECHRSP